MFIRAWIFGDKIGCPGFQNWAITQLLKLMRDDNVIESRTLRLVYEQRFSGSKLRVLAIDQLRWVLRRGGLPRKEDYPEYLTLAREFDAFGIDYLKTCLFVRDYHLNNPSEHPEKYMLSTAHADI